MVQIAFRWDKNREGGTGMTNAWETLNKMTVKLPPGMRTQIWINLQGVVKKNTVNV